MFNFIHKIIGKGTAAQQPQQFQQPSYQSVGSTFVVSDFHGNYPAFQRLKAALSPYDRVYMLGDACDRGTQGVKILLEVMNDPRFTYLVGNHDDFVLRTYLPQYVKSAEEDAEWAYYCWTHNYGPSIGEWENLRKNEKKFWKLVNWLANCPVMVSLYSEKSDTYYRLCHAKYPDVPDDTLSWAEFENKSHELLFNSLWDRYRDAPDPATFASPGFVTVVGHTPVDDSDCIVRTSIGNIVNIDGKLGYGNEVVRVLCLDDAKLYYLDGKSTLPSQYNCGPIKPVKYLQDAIFIDRISDAEISKNVAMENLQKGKKIFAYGQCFDHRFHGEYIATSDIRYIKGEFLHTRNTIYRMV